MKQCLGGKVLTWLALTCAGAMPFEATASVADADNGPYRSIIIRNVFGLREPPIVQTGPPIVVQPPPNVKLKGVTDILGYPQGVFEVQQVGKQPETFILGENERKGSLELVKVNLSDPEKRSANIILEGREITLLLDVPKTAASPLAVPPGMRTSSLPQPPGAPPQNTTLGTPAKEEEVNRILRELFPETEASGVRRGGRASGVATNSDALRGSRARGAAGRGGRGIAPPSEVPR